MAEADPVNPPTPDALAAAKAVIAQDEAIKAEALRVENERLAAEAAARLAAHPSAVDDPALAKLDAARKLIAENDSLLEKKSRAEARAKAAEAAAKAARGPAVEVSSFGRRTDGHQGMQLGMAPSGLSAQGVASDASAPAGLADNSTGAVIPTTVKPPVPVAKPELPFNKMIREASEAAAARAAADKSAALALSASMNEKPLTEAEKSALIANERLVAAQELADQAAAIAEAEHAAQASQDLVAEGVLERMGQTVVDLDAPKEPEPTPEYVPTDAEINEQLLADTRATIATAEARERELEAKVVLARSGLQRDVEPEPVIEPEPDPASLEAVDGRLDELKAELEAGDAAELAAKTEAPADTQVDESLTQAPETD